MTRRILVVGPSWVGDMVMAQPLVQSLQRHDGPNEVHVLAAPWVAGLVSRMPGVGQVIDNPFRHGELALGRRRVLARELRQRRYDQAVVLPNSLKSALIPWLARIPRRTGFRGELRLGLLNDIRALDTVAIPRLVDRFLLLAEAGGNQAPVPRLESPPARRAELRARLAADSDRPMACLCPGAEYGPAKRWPVRHFAALADTLVERGLDVWLLGSPKDSAVAAEIVSAARHPLLNLVGRTSLEDAVDLLADARVAVSNDSGLMHVAAAVGTPVVALFGSSSPDYTPPLSASARIVRHPVPCSPCFERECPLKHFACLEELLPPVVIAEVDAALSWKPGTGKA